MSSQNIFELHSFGGSTSSGQEEGVNDWHADSPWQESADRQGQPAAVMQFKLGECFEAGGVPVVIDEATGNPTRAGDGQTPIARFGVTRRKLGLALSMVTPEHSSVLVNGLPVLGLTVLSPQDSVVLSAGLHSYVTMRVRPHVGAPTQEMLSTKCPFCKLAVTAETRVVSCRCGVVYHAETEDSHPDAEDRLNCFDKVRACLSCSRPVVLDEFLTWDPATLSPAAE